MGSTGGDGEWGPQKPKRWGVRRVGGPKGGSKPTLGNPTLAILILPTLAKPTLAKPTLANEVEVV